MVYVIKIHTSPQAGTGKKQAIACLAVLMAGWMYRIDLGEEF
jgi:hypothetical protein